MKHGHNFGFHQNEPNLAMTDSGTEDGDEDIKDRTSGIIRVPNVTEYDASSGRSSLQSESYIPRKFTIDDGKSLQYFNISHFFNRKSDLLSHVLSLSLRPSRSI